jgi:FKBP-type peptidyl-prolyl cis-trans isomerase SlyD
LSQHVENKKIVSLTYVLREGGPEGQVLEVMDNTWPLVFLYGSGLMLSSFEERIKGLGEGEQFSFTLAADEAYGPVQEGNIVPVPLYVFQVKGVLQEHLTEPGGFVTLTDDLGDSHNGKVLERRKDSVVVDFNHALAGKDLHFDGEILHLRDASEEELRRNQYIETDGLRTGRNEPKL